MILARRHRRPIRPRLSALACVGLLAAPLSASADEPTRGENGAAPRIEAPPAPRVLHVPTAWLQSPRSVYASAGANHRGGGFFALSAGLGRLAEVDFNVTDRFLRCDADCDGDGREASSAWVASALFKIGMAADRLFGGQPALALGFRKSLWIAEGDTATPSSPRLAELYGVASRRLGAVGLHAGAQLFDVGTAGDRLLEREDPLSMVRPFAGLEWVPSIYPRTTLLLDWSWVPELQRPAEGSGYDVDLRWVAGWGIRYQALAWGSIELAVRHRESEGLADSTVLVRINGRLDLGHRRRD